MSIVGNIKLLKCLKNITFGELYLSTKLGSQKYFVTKKLRKKEVDKPEVKKHFENEIKILKELEHPNICKLDDYIQTQNHHYLVYEYINGGSLSDCFEQYKQKYNTQFFPEEIVQYIMRQVVNAIKYIHSKGIMHRNIQLGNIMINYSNTEDLKKINLLKGTIKIIDFGLAVKGLGKTFLNNKQYTDPFILKKYHESLAGKSNIKLMYDQTIDIWSLGATCYHMLIGKPVFDANSLNDLIKNVEEGNYTVPTILSSEVVSFLNSMLQYKSEKRLTAQQLSEHPFLVKDTSEFRRLKLKRVSKKINQYGLNINIKKNTTIWSIFNEEDEKQLIDINEKDLNFILKKSKSNSINQISIFPNFPQECQSLSTFDSLIPSSGFGSSVISNNTNMSNTHNIPNENSYVDKFPKIQRSFYGHNMHINDQIIENKQLIPNMQNNEREMSLHKKLRSGNINYPSNEMYNHYNFNHNIPGQVNQFNYYGENIGYNNKGHTGNSQNYNRPIDNIESNDKNDICSII